MILAGGGQPGLPAFRLEVARLFFRLPAGKGFLLAGGAALLAQHLTARPTLPGPCQALGLVPPSQADWNWIQSWLRRQ